MDYVYERKNLTVDVATYLMIEIFADKQRHKRDEIMRSVEIMHKERRGTMIWQSISTSNNPIRVIRSALELMQKTGKIIPLDGPAGWYISADASASAIQENAADASQQDADDEDDLTEAAIDQTVLHDPTVLSVVKTIGSGRQHVYLYYYPQTRAYYREILGRTSFPCKIGRSSVPDVQKRVRDQLRESTCFAPIIALDILCTDCIKLEKRIHLALASKRTADSWGTEWFDTTPEILEHVYERIVLYDEDLARLVSGKDLIFIMAQPEEQSSVVSFQLAQE